MIFMRAYAFCFLMFIHVFVFMLFYFYLSCTVGIRACMKAMNLVEEELYEIDLDNQGCQGGPKAGRLRASANVSIFSLHFMSLQILFALSIRISSVLLKVLNYSLQLL